MADSGSGDDEKTPPPRGDGFTKENVDQEVLSFCAVETFRF